MTTTPEFTQALDVTSAADNETATPKGGCPVAHIQWAGPARRPLSGFEMLDRLRSDGPLHQVSVGSGSFYLVTEYETALKVAQDAKTFPQTSHVMETGDEMPFTLIPENLNGPEHTKWRRLLAPYFSPGRVTGWDDKVRSRANALIDEFIESGSCDFVNDFALRYPTAIFLEIMGLPVEELDQLLSWETAILHPAVDDPRAGAALMQQAQAEVTQYFMTVIADRRAQPVETRPPGLVTDALDWTIDGEQVSDQDLLMFYLLMFMAGLDTVTAELGYGFLHLATHPQDRQRLVEDPAIIPNAMEELLRAYPIVNTPREVTEETEIGGCPVRPGDFVVISYPSAGRDDAVYPNAASVDFDRPDLSHLTFGAGPHRCLGSHLARHELTIAYEEWHKRIPEYRLAEGKPFDEATSGMMTLNSLPLAWNPS